MRNGYVNWIVTTKFIVDFNDAPLGFYRQHLAMEITLGWRRLKAACDGSILDLHHFQVIGIILSGGIGKKR